MSHEHARRLLTVRGTSPLVINATTGIATWVTGQTQSTPISVLSVTNPSLTNSLALNVAVYHGVQGQVAQSASPKTTTLSMYSLISFDPGTGTLALLPPSFFGSGQIAVQATDHDLGVTTGAGNQNASTLLTQISVPPGGTVILRSQSTLTIRDPHASAMAWTYNQITAEGQVLE